MVDEAAIRSPLSVYILERTLGWTVFFVTLCLGIRAHHPSRSLLQYRLSTALPGRGHDSVYAGCTHRVAVCTNRNRRGTPARSTRAPGRERGNDLRISGV